MEVTKKSKDYYIIKICYYADAYLKYNHKETEKTIKEHWERAKTYQVFKWKFIEKVTGLPQKYWHTTYPFYASECAFEQIEEEHQIICELCNGGWFTYLIPRENTELFEWVKENLPDNPYKVMKKISLSWRSYSNKNLKYKREQALAFAKGLNLPKKINLV